MSERANEMEMRNSAGWRDPHGLVLRQMILKGKDRGDETSPRETEEGLRPYAGRLDRLAASQECRLLDGGKNLGASLGVELVPVQPKEQALAERCDRGTRVLFQEGSLHDGACSVAHAAPHYQPLFTGSLHERCPIPLF